MSEPVFAFKVWCPMLGEGGTVINHRNRGGAMSEYLRLVQEAWPSVQYTDLRARKQGPAVTTPEFLRVARRRGYPGVRCGDRAFFRCGSQRRPCVIVGHNSSDNFEVLFSPDGPRRGFIGNVHPFDLDLNP